MEAHLIRKIKKQKSKNLLLLAMWPIAANMNSKWRITDFAEAQHRANFGCPTIALSPNVQNQLGHAAVVRPNNGSTPNSKADVYITQAGKSVFKNRKLSEGWVVGSAQYNAIRFFTWLY